MRSILCLCMILAFVGCKKSNDLEDVSKEEMESIAVCINSIDQLKKLNNDADTFIVTRIVLDDDSEVIPDGQNLAVAYSVKPTSGGNSLFDSCLKIRVKENDVFKTYAATVWSMGCKDAREVQGAYTNLIKGTAIYKVNTYFNWIVEPYGAGGPRIKYLAVD